jgi:hypothetical protein
MFNPTSTALKPLRKLGVHGSALWNVIMAEYHLDDAGGLEILQQACECADRIGRLAERIEADGEIIETKSGMRAHPLLKDEVSNRAFLVRTLERLGLNLEVVKPLGRPSGAAWKKQEDRDADH